MFLLIFYYSCMYYNMHSQHCGLFPFHYKWICWCTCCCATTLVSMWPLSPSYMDMVPIATYIPNFVVWNTMGVLVYSIDFVNVGTCWNWSSTFVCTTLVCVTRWTSSYSNNFFPLWQFLPSFLEVLLIAPQVFIHLYLPQIGLCLMLQNCPLELQKVIYTQARGNLPYMPSTSFYILFHILYANQIAPIHLFTKDLIPNFTSHQCLMFLTPWIVFWFSR